MFLFGGGGLTLLLARGGGSTSLGLHMPPFEFLVAWGDIGLGRGPDAENMFSRLGVYGTGFVARRGGGAYVNTSAQLHLKSWHGGCCMMTASSLQVLAPSLNVH